MRFLFVFILTFPLLADAQMSTSDVKKITVTELMSKVRKRIKPFKWDATFFHDQDWLIGGYSVNGSPLMYWTCGNAESKNRSLVLSAVHGDEITPVYFGFRLVEWVKARPEICKDKFVVIAPLVNPDGFLRYTRGTRTNYNKVDLNRNFDTPEWHDHAHHLWQSKYNKRRRYYPGKQAGNQPETFFQKWLIHEFKINKILSVHAPLNILDYDGPKNIEGDELAKAYFESCYDLKEKVVKATPELRFFAYGTFPGSLGNYAGKHLGIPTITAELPSIRAENAMKYFADMEEGNRIFFEYEIQNRPKYLEDKSKITVQVKND